jgi:hypothetical protein
MSIILKILLSGNPGASHNSQGRLLDGIYLSSEWALRSRLSIVDVTRCLDILLNQRSPASGVVSLVYLLSFESFQDDDPMPVGLGIVTEPG